MLPDYFEFCLPTRVIYGAGIHRQLEDQLAFLGPRNVILVTDKVLVQNGLTQKVLDGLKKSSLTVKTVFDDVPPNSTIQTVINCASDAVKHGCDLFIAVGGGSVIDTAKVANLLAVKGGQLSDHMGAYLLEKSDSLHPSIYIPTTAGTGSEVTKVAVIADPENDVKLPFSEDQFLPLLAVLDPELTLSMPGKLTAATGMDALTHAIEAYVDKECSPASDAMALQAVKLISSHLLQACAKPEDIQARGAVLVGSFLAGVAFSHSMVGMTHGIAHALGGVYHIPHGLANALILPEVMLYNLEERLDRFAELGLAMGVNYPQVVSQSKSLLQDNGLLSNLIDRVIPAPPLAQWFGEKAHLAQEMTSEALDYLGFVDQWMHRQAAQAGVEKVRMLNRQLSYLTEMPLNLRDAGIDDNLAKLEQVVQTAMEDGSMLYNPVEPRKDAVRDIIKKVFHSKATPVFVTSKDLKTSSASGSEERKKNVFVDSDMVYEVIGGFFLVLKEHPEIGPALASTGLCIRFEYVHPSAAITVDATGDELHVFHGDCEKKPEVTMSMNADFAHLFWHGKANLVTALTRRWVRAKGNVPKTLKLLPVLKPAFELYPKYLEEKGLSKLIL